jgi:hypothetical protein
MSCQDCRCWEVDFTVPDTADDRLRRVLSFCTIVKARGELTSGYLINLDPEMSSSSEGGRLCHELTPDCQLTLRRARLARFVEPSIPLYRWLDWTIVVDELRYGQ